jgi:tetratricopeptide (TPR) repeat protein
MANHPNTRTNPLTAPSRRLLGIRLILLIAVLLVFGRILGNDFVNWDDNPLIYANPNITRPTFSGLIHHWNPNDPNNSEMYDPLVFTTWWSLAHIAQLENADFLGSKLNPYVFHAANLLVHWLSACVVLEILRKLKIADWAALAGALIFAVHPIQTEAVAWVTAMKDLLSGLFALLAIWQYILAMQSPAKRRKWTYLLATICFVAALLSKPSTVVVPLIVATIDRLMFARPWRQIAKWIWPWLLLALGCGLLTVWVQPPHYVDVGPIWARPLVAMDALAFYLYKIVLPINLSFDYGRNPLALLNDPNLHHALYWTWIVPVAVVIVLARIRQPAITVAGMIFLLGVLPVLGLKTFVFQYYTTVADRYVYISMLGIALAAGWLMNRHHNRIAIALFLAIFATLGSLSFVQAGRWKDTESLYDYGLHLNKTRALHYLIFADYKDHLAGAAQSLKEREDYLEQAADLYRQAIALEPANTNGYDRLARDLVRLNQIPAAIDVVRQWMAVDSKINSKTDSTLREKPGTLEAMLGSLYLKNGQYPQAIDHLRRSLQTAPDPDTQKLLDAATQRSTRSH